MNKIINIIKNGKRDIPVDAIYTYQINKNDFQFLICVKGKFHEPYTFNRVDNVNKENIPTSANFFATNAIRTSVIHFNLGSNVIELTSHDSSVIKEMVDKINTDGLLNSNDLHKLHSLAIKHIKYVTEYYKKIELNTAKRSRHYDESIEFLEELDK